MTIITEPTCIFCQIIAGTEPARVVGDWFDALAIVPLNPVVTGHIIVMPKAHVIDYTIDPVVTASTMARAAQMAEDPTYFPSNLITSAGHEATQSVFHLHIHIVPRRANDGLALPWHSGKSKQVKA